ncbi:hypothetical protein OTU49_016340, partial [Cherax quadricarinatus]
LEAAPVPNVSDDHNPIHSGILAQAPPTSDPPHYHQVSTTSGPSQHHKYPPHLVHPSTTSIHHIWSIPPLQSLPPHSVHPTVTPITTSSSSHHHQVSPSGANACYKNR